MFLLEAAARGAYVAFIPSSVVRDAIKAKRLRSIATLLPEHAGIHAIYKDAVGVDRVRRAVATLVEYVREHESESV